MFFARNRLRNMHWLAILAYPLAFIKGLLIGQLLGRRAPRE